MTEDEPIPEVLLAEWSTDQILDLFSDLQEGAEVLFVQLRTSSSDQPATLQDAKRSFVNGMALAIQVRYRFEGELWSDTILAGDPTSRIIRSRLPESSI